MIWMGIAAIMLAIEIVRVHSFFIWLSAGAASAGILALLGVPVSGQIVTFINLSGILILLERRFSERYTFKPPQPHSAVQESINRPGVAAAQEIDENLNVFRKWGELWEIRYADRSCTMKHSIGLVHIRNLIIHNSYREVDSLFGAEANLP
jgi:membrane protein implicated in regulation of membrane protease activity